MLGGATLTVGAYIRHFEHIGQGNNQGEEEELWEEFNNEQEGEENYHVEIAHVHEEKEKLCKESDHDQEGKENYYEEKAH